MELTTLPWFIRREIIEIVIEHQPGYCSISKEWLKCVAKRHGTLVFDSYNVPKKEITLFTLQVGKLMFLRSENIDWNLVYQNKTIDNVYVCASDRNVSIVHQGLLDKCLTFPKLFRLCFHVDQGVIVDLNSLLKKNCLHLKELSITTKDTISCSALETTMFPNLTKLDLIDGDFSLTISKLTNTVPKLKILSLRFDMPPDLNIFEMATFQDLVELTIHKFYHPFKSFAKVDLSKFPKLKRLRAIGNLEFLNRTPFNTIKELNITGSVDYLTRTIFDHFSSLTKLVLCIPQSPEIDELHSLLQSLNTIPDLHLKLWIETEHLINLPVGSYSVATLRLDGPFRITYPLLDWLSSSFRLKKLELHGCFLEEDALSKSVAFNHLTHVSIETARFKNRFEQYFNRTHFPKLISVSTFDCNCS